MAPSHGYPDTDIRWDQAAVRGGPIASTTAGAYSGRYVCILFRPNATGGRPWGSRSKAGFSAARGPGGGERLGDLLEMGQSIMVASSE